MDLTVPISAVAMLVAVGTVLLVIRELIRTLWFVLPRWVRFATVGSLAAVFFILLSIL